MTLTSDDDCACANDVTFSIFEQGGDCSQWDGALLTGICGSPDFFLQLICLENGKYRVLIGCDDSTLGSVDICIVSCVPFFISGCVTMVDTGTPSSPCCLGVICFEITEP